MTDDNAKMDHFLMILQVFHSLVMMGRKEEADLILSQGMIPIMKSMEPDKQRNFNQEAETVGAVQQESVQQEGNRKCCK
jgi:tetrahydromethanopterin S-methyltransferase subunit A